MEKTLEELEEIRRNFEEYFEGMNSYDENPEDRAILHSKLENVVLTGKEIIRIGLMNNQTNNQKKFYCI